MLFGKFSEKNFLLFVRGSFSGPLFGDSEGVFRLVAGPVSGRDSGRFLVVKVF